MSSDADGVGPSPDPLGDVEPRLVPSWVWGVFVVGLAIGLFGVLILIMGSLMSETGAPRGGDFIEVRTYSVSDWIYWLGGSCVVLGTALAWPGYRAALGRRASTPAPAWVAPGVVVIGLTVSVLALPVALAAAPHSGLRGQAFFVTGVVWLMLAGGAIAAAVVRSRERSRQTDAAEATTEAAPVDPPETMANDEPTAVPHDPAETPFAAGTDDRRPLTESDREDLRRRWPPG